MLGRHQCTGGSRLVRDCVTVAPHGLVASQEGLKGPSKCHAPRTDAKISLVARRCAIWTLFYLCWRFLECHQQLAKAAAASSVLQPVVGTHCRATPRTSFASRKSCIPPILSPTNAWQLDIGVCNPRDKYELASHSHL